MRLDWPEDFSHENGNYQNICCECGKYFAGHKRRIVCRRCAKYPKWKKELKAFLKRVL